MVAFSSGSVLTAAALNSAFNSATINAQTSTTYTFVSSDAGELVTLSNASGGTATIPTNATWAAATGTEIDVLNTGAGTWVLAGAGGVTLNGSVSIPTNGRVRLLKTATNTWYSSAMDAAVSALSINAKTASYTLVFSDANSQVEINSASGTTLTVPTNATVPFPIGTGIVIAQTGAGQITVAGAGGVTVNATPGLKLFGQWSVAVLVKRATDTWLLAGDLSA